MPNFCKQDASYLTRRRCMLIVIQNEADGPLAVHPLLLITLLNCSMYFHRAALPGSI